MAVREPLDAPSRPIEGLSRPVNFDVPDYSIVSDPHCPDFRSTIHWDPVVKTDANGKAPVEFFCSDDVGKLSIRVDGLAKGGRPFSAVHSIEVVAGAEKSSLIKKNIRCITFVREMRNFLCAPLMKLAQARSISGCRKMQNTGGKSSALCFHRPKDMKVCAFFTSRT